MNRKDSAYGILLIIDWRSGSTVKPQIVRTDIKIIVRRAKEISCLRNNIKDKRLDKSLRNPLKN